MNSNFSHFAAIMAMSKNQTRGRERNEYLELLGRVHQEEAILLDLCEAAEFDLQRASTPYLDAQRQRLDFMTKMLEAFRTQIMPEAWQVKYKDLHPTVMAQ